MTRMKRGKNANAEDEKEGKNANVEDGNDDDNDPNEDEAGIILRR